MWACDRKRVYRNSGEGMQEGERVPQEWPLSNGDSQPVRPEDDRRSGSDDLQVTKRRVCSRRGKSSEETRRRVSLFQLWVRVERSKSAGSGSKKNAADFVSSLPCNSQPRALHLVRSSSSSGLPIYRWRCAKRAKGSTLAMTAFYSVVTFRRLDDRKNEKN
jgi:hypothetical protein